MQKRDPSNVAVQRDERRVVAYPLVPFVRDGQYHVQQQFPRQLLHLGQPRDLGKVVHDHAEGVVLYVRDVHLVGSLEDLQHVVVRDVVL